MKYFYWVTLLILLFWLAVVELNAQNRSEKQGKYQISGKVIDENKVPLEYATVQLYLTQDSSLVTGSVTDSEGNFKISADEGEYYVIVSYISFESKIFRDVNLNAQKTSIRLGVITLATSAQALDEIKVIAEKSTMEIQLDKRVFNVGKDLANLGGNAIQILNNIPSVTVDIEGNVSLRGSQNVRILIDGRPSGLTGIGNSEALRLLQGNLIERVEVVTNPSARYEAEGEVGIINIILRKEVQKGINGSFDANIGYPENFGVAFNLNYRAKWLNFFTSYGINYRDSPGVGESNQRFFDENGNTTSSFLTTQDRSRANLGNTLRAGADVFFNPKNILTFSGLYRISDGNNIANLRYDDFDAAGNFTQTVLRNQDENEESKNIEISLDHKVEFIRKGHEWNSSFKWIKSNDIEQADLFENNLNITPSQPIVQNSYNTEFEENIIIQTDYIQPFGENARLEAGFRAGFRSIDNDFLVEQLNAENTFEPLADFDNTFKFRENILAFYAMLGNKWNKFSAQLGLRGENTDINAALVNATQNSDQNYFNLFPSAFFAYELNKANTFQLNYSRRLSRPQFRLLLPFSNFSDSRNFRAGNPSLRPEFTHSFEAGHLFNWKNGNILSNVYYRRRTGVIERITLLGEDLEAIDIPGIEGSQIQNVVVPVNLAIQNAVGIEFTITQDIAKWWTVNGNANFYRASTSGSFIGRSYENIATTVNARIANRLDLPKNFTIQANARYLAPERNTQGIRKSITVIDLAFAKDLLKGNATLSLSINDLLNNNRNRVEILGSNFFTESDFQWRARQILLNFTFRLKQKKENKQKNSGFNGTDD